MKRLALFVYRCIRLRSVSLARWVQEYEDHTPNYGDDK